MTTLWIRFEGNSHGRHDGRLRGTWRGGRIPQSFQGYAGSAAARQGHVSARWGAPVGAARGAGRGRILRRYRPVWPHETGVSPTLQAIPRWYAIARPPRRHLRRPRRGALPTLLRGLGRLADRRSEGRGGDRRQDGAPIWWQGRKRRHSYGLRLRRGTASGAGTGEGGGKIQ